MTVTENENRVIEVLVNIFQGKELSPPLLSPTTPLEQIGLESLDFAQAVIQLEELTGKDPFASARDVQVRTIADFAVLYD